MLIAAIAQRELIWHSRRKAESERGESQRKMVNGNKKSGEFSKIIYLTVAYEPQSISSQQPVSQSRQDAFQIPFKYLFMEPLGAF